MGQKTVSLLTCLWGPFGQRAGYLIIYSSGRDRDGEAQESPKQGTPVHSDHARVTLQALSDTSLDLVPLFQKELSLSGSHQLSLRAP